MGNLYSGTNTTSISDNFLSKNDFNSYTSTAPKVLDLNTVLADSTLTKKLLDALSGDSRFKGPQGIQGIQGNVGPQGTMDTTKNYTFTDTITFNKPIKIYKNIVGGSIDFIGGVTGKTNTNGTFTESKLQIDQDGNNSGDYVIFTSIPNYNWTNLNIQPQGGNVRIGYNPNKYANDVQTIPPDAKLAVNGNIYSSSDIISGGQFTSKNGYQIENIYKIQFPESKDNNGNEGALKYAVTYDQTNTQNGYYRTNTSSGDIAKFKILSNGSTLGDNLKFTNDPNIINDCLAVSDGTRRALTKKTCNTNDPSQHFVRNGIKIYNPYSDLCININSSTGLWSCMDENNQKTSFRPV